LRASSFVAFDGRFIRGWIADDLWHDEEGGVIWAKAVALPR
jgi:hypothetical protein